MQLKESQLFASRYMLLRRLGAGGFSEVWLAGDTKTGVEVALKVYATHGGMDDDGVKVFSSEYSGVFNINHSNLLRPSHYDVEGNCPYLVMPYLSNGSAKKYIGCIPEEEAWKFIRDVASGLAYMHSFNPPMIHQDIKPDNVLIDNRGVYQITDFGISTRARNTLRKSAMAAGVESGGTTAYMGPERFSKEPMPIKASDRLRLRMNASDRLQLKLNVSGRLQLRTNASDRLQLKMNVKQERNRSNQVDIPTATPTLTSAFRAALCGRRATWVQTLLKTTATITPGARPRPRTHTTGIHTSTAEAILFLILILQSIAPNQFSALLTTKRFLK